jgi:hypothetical protein
MNASFAVATSASSMQKARPLGRVAIISTQCHAPCVSALAANAIPGVLLPVV